MTPTREHDGPAAEPAPSGAKPRPTGTGTAMPNDGFDRWVRRQLHRLYDPAAAEPIPARLADLLDRFPSADDAADAAERPASADKGDDHG